MNILCTMKQKESIDGEIRKAVLGTNNVETNNKDYLLTPFSAFVTAKSPMLNVVR